MNKHTSICRRRKTALSAVLVLLLISGLLTALAPDATAAVDLLYFKATAGGDKIQVEWKTATEQDIVGFNLYRSQDSGSKGQQIGDTFSNRGSEVSGADYSHPDTDVLKGVRYYYSLEEISASGGLTIVATAASTLTPAPTPTATRTPTATNVPGGTSGVQPTATRQFTLTPRPATAAPGSTPTPPSGTSVTATPIGAVVLSTPTGGPQPPTVAPLTAAATTVPTPLSPVEPTVLAMSPSPEIVATSTVQSVDEVTPTATPPPEVFAAATAQPLLGTPGRAAAEPTPVPAGEAPRNTGSIFLLGGGAILLAAALGGGILLYLRSRKS
jgi:hypothetical protein